MSCAGHDFSSWCSNQLLNCSMLQKVQPIGCCVDRIATHQQSSPSNGFVWKGPLASRDCFCFVRCCGGAGGFLCLYSAHVLFQRRQTCMVSFRALPCNQSSFRRRPVCLQRTHHPGIHSLSTATPAAQCFFSAWNKLSGSLHLKHYIRRLGQDKLRIVVACITWSCG